MATATNPILSGFYPDPSICRVDDTFYLVNSSFAYFPGVPIFKSKDLAHWEQIGNILNRDSQLPLDNETHSGGIFAPTIRYHEGTFYMITTNIRQGGNFIVTAECPEGPWSEPHYLEGAVGIDPSLFFDDDGKCYYVGTRPNPDGERYSGDWMDYVWELDTKTFQFVGDYKIIWNGALRMCIWPEGPHIYKKDGFYYLVVAEGGTSWEHCVTVARSEGIFGPYEGFRKNPILTHRHLGKNYPIQFVGHSDFVDTKDGDWYLVCLASRRCEGFTNLGRETFLAEVTWEEGWPVVNEGYGKLRDVQEVKLPEVLTTPVPEYYDFSFSALPPQFVYLRNMREQFFSLTDRKNALRLYLRPETLSEQCNPSYLCVRQPAYHFTAAVQMEFEPKSENEAAGIALVQKNTSQLRTEICLKDGKRVIQVTKVTAEQVESFVYEPECVADLAIRSLYIEFSQVGQRLKVSVGTCKEDAKAVQYDIDTTYLSTEVCGGFVGVTVGMYASSNGSPSGNYADFTHFVCKKGE